MLYIITQYPRHCPGCGVAFPWAKRTNDSAFDRSDITDFFAGASQSCLGCGAQFAYAPPSIIIDAATQQGSDLERYADRQPH